MVRVTLGMTGSAGAPQVVELAEGRVVGAKDGFVFVLNGRAATGGDAIAVFNARDVVSAIVDRS
jgi:hypothetical protein